MKRRGKKTRGRNEQEQEEKEEEEEEEEMNDRLLTSPLCVSSIKEALLRLSSAAIQSTM